jgi:hypothetical protein
MEDESIMTNGQATIAANLEKANEQPSNQTGRTTTNQRTVSQQGKTQRRMMMKGSKERTGKQPTDHTIKLTREGGGMLSNIVQIESQSW